MEELQYKTGDIIHLIPEQGIMTGLHSFGMVINNPDETCRVETPTRTVHISNRYSTFPLATEEEKSIFIQAVSLESQRLLEILDIAKNS